MPAPYYHNLPSMSPAEALRCALQDKLAIVRKMMGPFEQLRRKHLKGDRTAVLAPAVGRVTGRENKSPMPSIRMAAG